MLCQPEIIVIGKVTSCLLCLQFDYGGEEGDGGDEMDDFEAQMRALQEQL